MILRKIRHINGEMNLVDTVKNDNIIGSCIFQLRHSFLLNTFILNKNEILHYKTGSKVWSSQPSYLYDENTVSNGGFVEAIDNLVCLRSVVNELNHNQSIEYRGINKVTVSKLRNKESLIFKINGTNEFINQCKQVILTNYDLVKCSSIHVKNVKRVSSDFLRKLDELSLMYNVEISVICVIKQRKEDLSGNCNFANDIRICILGSHESTVHAEYCINIFVDSLVHNYYIDFFEVDILIIPIVGGVGLKNFKEIALQNDVNIYISSLTTNIFRKKLNFERKKNLWITSKNCYNLILAKKNLIDVIKTFSSSVGSECKVRLMMKEIDLLKIKIDLLTLFNLNEIHDIMIKHNVYIRIPDLGHPNSYKIYVYGISLHAIDEAINLLSFFCSNYPTISLFNESPSNHNLIEKFEKHSCLSDTLIIVENSNGIDITGNREDLKKFLDKLEKKNISFKNYSSSKLRFEINLNQADFISGKKNGKLVSILNQLNQKLKISYNAFNDISFFIDFDFIHPTESKLILLALKLFEMELLAELEFNVPVIFHKSTIGYGGWLIQSIMKKYNVFIKFSSDSSDQKNYTDFTFHRYNNVLIKCPLKNELNIKNAKDSIIQFVYDYLDRNKTIDQDPFNTQNFYYVKTFKLLKIHYLLILSNNKVKNIHKLEEKYRILIDFPESISSLPPDSNSFTLKIKGTKAKLNKCFSLFVKLLPFNYEIRFKKNDLLFNKHSGYPQNFQDRIVFSFKFLFGIEVLLNEIPLKGKVNGSDSYFFDRNPQIILSSYDEIFILRAIDILVLYLTEEGFDVYSTKRFYFDMEIESDSSNIPLQSSSKTNKDSHVLKLITNEIINKNYPLHHSNQRTIKSKYAQSDYKVVV